MSFDLRHILQQMDPFAIAIVVSLVVMAMASLSVFVERLWVMSRSRRASRRFAARAAQRVSAGELAELASDGEREKGSHLASLVAAGLKTYLAACKKPGELQPVELARRELARKGDAIGAELRRGMNLLASVGSTSPFVGLLGTVVGIIAAFQGIAREGSGGLGAVSAGIAEALVVTALGLVVAIPSVLAFNFLSARVDALLVALDRSRSELVDHLENRRQPGRADAQDKESRTHAAA
jgi:biopolymer transport protein ExbB